MLRHAVITSVDFKNFKALRDATLPLGPLTLVVGPNGSGKTTALRALQMIGSGAQRDAASVRTVGVASTAKPEIRVHWGPPFDWVTGMWRMQPTPPGVYAQTSLQPQTAGGHQLRQEEWQRLWAELAGMHVYAFDAEKVAQAVQLHAGVTLEATGANLVVVLDRLRDVAPERFEAFNDELGTWFSDFDRVVFDTPQPGIRRFGLRTRVGQHPILSSDLSHGT